MARKREPRIGPITLNDIVNCYKSLFNDEPSGVALGQLMRLPCLVSSGQEVLDRSAELGDALRSESKSFLSYELVEVASSNSLCAFLKNYQKANVNSFTGVKFSIGNCGAEHIIRFCESHGYNEQNLSSAISSINDISMNNFAQIDLLFALFSWGKRYSSKYIFIENCEIDRLYLDEINCDYSKVTFRDCYIRSLVVTSNSKISYLPIFDGCLVEQFTTDCGWNFVESMLGTCDVEHRSIEESTSNSYLESSLPENVKLLCTVLHKIYVQPGGGRLEGALRRGVRADQIPKIDEIVKLLQRKEMIYHTKAGNENRWHPVPSMVTKVKRFLSGPKTRVASDFV